MTARTARCGEDGFALTEAVASIFIAAIVASSVLAALTTARAMADEARARTRALQLAQSLLVDAAHPDAFGFADEGVTDDGRLAWRRVMSPLDAMEASNLREVRVEVDWRSARDVGTMQLETVVLRHEPQ